MEPASAARDAPGVWGYLMAERDMAGACKEVEELLLAWGLPPPQPLCMQRGWVGRAQGFPRELGAEGRSEAKHDIRRNCRPGFL